MATENQKQFVADIESAIAAIRMKNPDRPPERLTINEVCELAGRNSIDMRAMVLRIAAKPEDGHLLRRLLHAFKSVDLCPQYLAQAVGEIEQKGHSDKNEQTKVLEPLKFAAPPPPSPTPPVAVPKLITTHGQAIEMPTAAPKQMSSPGEVMNQIIRILDDLPEKQQRRVIVSVSAYFGIGE